MAYIEIDLKHEDLRLTKQAYFKIFGKLQKGGLGIKESFDKIDDFCNRTGHHNYYSSFQSFKTAYYCREK